MRLYLVEEVCREEREHKGGKIGEPKEDFRRLGFFLGVLGLILWTIFYFFGLFWIISSYGQEHFYIMGLPFSFHVPWGITKLLKWMLDDFRK